MNTQTIILSVGLLAALVVGMFTYTYLAREQSEQTPVPQAPVETPLPDPYGITRIEAKHFYRDGVHTIVGELPMPTPCDLLESTARVAESYPEQVTFDFTVINNADNCAQVVTVQRFMVQASASDQANLQATFRGRPVELNLVEADPSESPEDFELYIKG